MEGRIYFFSREEYLHRTVNLFYMQIIMKLTKLNIVIGEKRFSSDKREFKMVFNMGANPSLNIILFCYY